MKVRNLLAVGTLALLMSAVATDATAKANEPPSKVKDSGTLGVFMKGKRVATETFSIEETAGGSSAKSQFKTEEGVDKAVQSSELLLTASGDLRKYEWKELSPGKAQAVVTPNDSFLMERSTTNPGDKPEDHPFLLPVSTNILDDYVFIHREILLWKYLATACRQEKGQLQCQLKQPTQFGTMNPHARSSMSVTVEFRGREKMSIRGTERELNAFSLKSDAGDWALWLDDQFMLVRILIPADDTEVLRD